MDLFWDPGVVADLWLKSSVNISFSLLIGDHTPFSVWIFATKLVLLVWLCFFYIPVEWYFFSSTSLLHRLFQIADLSVQKIAGHFMLFCTSDFRPLSWNHELYYHDVSFDRAWQGLCAKISCKLSEGGFSSGVICLTESWYKFSLCWHAANPLLVSQNHAKRQQLEPAKKHRADLYETCVDLLRTFT